MDFSPITSEIIEKLSCLGYLSKVSHKVSSVVIVLIPKGSENRAQFLAEFVTAVFTDSVYLSKHALKTTARSTAGGVMYKGVTIIAKDGGSIKTAAHKTLHQLDARIFSAGGKKAKKEYHGKGVPCLRFDSAEQIERSILKGLNSDDLLGRMYGNQFKKFFGGGRLEWDAKKHDDALINKLGVYVGELLSGWVLLSQGRHSQYVRGDAPFLGSGKNSAFYIPTDPLFSGVDSFVVSEDGETYGISSKFDGGAKGSVFSNILPLAIERMNAGELRSGSTLFELASICRKLAVPPAKNAKKIVYSWGVENFFNMRGKGVPWVIPDEIKVGRVSPYTEEVITLATRTMEKQRDTSRLAKMPLSLSAFFCKQLQEALSADSYDEMLDIVSAKGYYQFNMNKISFLKGDLKFNCVKAGSAGIQIHSGKGAIDDLSQSNGWVNFEVKKN